MKLLFLAIAVCFSASLQAQEVNIADKSKLLERALQFKISGKDTMKKKPFDLVIEKLQDGRVRILTQDGMPCIIPDTSSIVAIPNAFKPEAGKDPAPGRIPNAWQAPKAVPDVSGAK